MEVSRQPGYRPTTCGRAVKKCGLDAQCTGGEAGAGMPFFFHHHENLSRFPRPAHRDRAGCRRLSCIGAKQSSRRGRVGQPHRAAFAGRIACHHPDHARRDRAGPAARPADPAAARRRRGDRPEWRPRHGGQRFYPGRGIAPHAGADRRCADQQPQLRHRGTGASAAGGRGAHRDCARQRLQPVRDRGAGRRDPDFHARSGSGTAGQCGGAAWQPWPGPTDGQWIGAPGVGHASARIGGVVARPGLQRHQPGGTAGHQPGPRRLPETLGVPGHHARAGRWQHAWPAPARRARHHAVRQPVRPGDAGR